jgi:hypothetical protein
MRRAGAAGGLLLVERDGLTPHLFLHGIEIVVASALKGGMGQDVHRDGPPYLRRRLGFLPRFHCRFVRFHVFGVLVSARTVLGLALVLNASQTFLHQIV